MRAGTALALTLVLARAATGDVEVPPDAAAPADWAQDVADYARDPTHNRRLVERFGRAAPDGMPPLLALMLADARFRAGQDRAASRLLERVLRDLSDGRGTTPRLLLAVIALADGDAARLDDLAPALTAFSVPAGQTATLLRGLAVTGTDPSGAADDLDRLGRDPALVPALRPAVRHAAALARLWAGDAPGAAVQLDALAAGRDAGRLADDARYAAAVVRWHVGAHGHALDALAALARDGGERRAPGVSRARLLLERDAVVHAGIARLRGRPLAPPEDHAVLLFDEDGPALARRALELLAGDASAPTPAANAPAPSAPIPAASGDAAPPAVGTGAARAPQPGPASGAPQPAAALWGRWFAAAALVALAIVALARRASATSRARRATTAATRSGRASRPG